MGFKLYDEYGWINIPEIAKLGKWLNIIIGPRQVGKTYGTTKFLLEQGKQFIYMRRTEKEFELIEADPDLNPFLKMEKEGFPNIDIITLKKVRTIGHVYYDDNGKAHIDKKIANGMTIQQVAQVRGFDGSKYHDLFFDEFIPEQLVIKRKGEGEGFMNAYVTINGNRELEGNPPLRCWLLANSNDITSPILEELYMTGEVEKLIRSGKEYKIGESFFLALPHSEAIIEKRKETALMKHLKGRGKFYQMAMENKFAYNDMAKIKNLPIKGMKCLLKMGDIYIYDNGSTYYACEIKGNCRKQYELTPAGSRQVQIDFPELRAMYNFNYMFFQNVNAMTTFKRFLKIED